MVCFRRFFDFHYSLDLFFIQIACILYTQQLRIWNNDDTDSFFFYFLVTNFIIGAIFINYLLENTPAILIIIYTIKVTF